MLGWLRLLSSRYLRRRWERVALVVISIALGVATLVSTQILNRCVQAATKSATTPLQGDAQLIVSNGEVGVPTALAAELRRVPGVREVRPLLIERVQLPEFGNRIGLLVGVEWPKGGAASEQPGMAIKITQPLALLQARPALLGRELYSDWQRSGTPSLQLRSAGVPASIAPAGTVAIADDAAGLNRMLIVMPFEKAALLVRPNALATRFDLVLEPASKPEAVRRAIDAALSGRARVESPQAHGQSTQEAISGVQIGLAMCGAGALVVGLFLVYNTLSVSVAERRREIGILRALGATRGQIGLLFTVEAALQGSIGSLVGIPFGIALAYLALHPLQQVLNEVFMPMEPATLQLPASTLLFATLAGIATTVFASLVPAWQASRDEPAEAVRRTPSGSARFFLGIQAGMSLLLILTGVALGFGRAWLPMRVGSYGSVVLVLTGAMLAMPLLTMICARFLIPLVQWLPGVELRLAADNLLRAPGRTGIVIGALAAGVALMVQIAGVGLSNERPVLAWVERTITPDLFVMVGESATAASNTQPIAPEYVAELQALPGVAHVLPIRFRRPEFRDTTVMIIACDMLTYCRANRGKPEVPNLQKFERLIEPNTTIVSENFLELHGFKVGDTVSLQGPRGPFEVTILGAVEDFSWNRGSLFIDAAQYRAQFDDPQIDIVHVFLDPASPDAAERVRKLAQERALFVMTRADLRTYVTDVIRRLYMLLYLQQAVVAVVSTLGVVAALLISILQRRREIGLLRAVGATPQQILRSVLAESLLMGLIGTFLGGVVGLGLEWYLLNVIIHEESGICFPMAIPWQTGTAIAAASVGSATLAGLIPALHAMRIRIVEAIAWE